MLGWPRRQPAPPPDFRDALLRAIPLRNELVRETPAPDGLRLSGPARSPWRRVFGARPDKTFELDELGAFVWEGINGRRTVEEAIRRFAQDKRVNLREAEVAVLAFLKTLVKRGLVVMVADKPVPKSRKRRK
jgi:hypothetical protein